tara:strand:+ start:353 stop:853 length:501 start_codon:yes stop_codon:yes gene_type:complete
MNRQVKVIQDFLPENLHNEIYNVLTNNKFPWYYSSSVSSELEPINKKDFFFYHNLYLQNYVSNDYFHQLLMPILGRLNFNYIIRSKINLYPKKEEPFVHDLHTDFQTNHMVALYSVNTNNGSTVFEGGEKVSSKANELLLFDGSIKHASCVQTDENVRINIVVNFK